MEVGANFFPYDPVVGAENLPCKDVEDQKVLRERVKNTRRQKVDISLDMDLVRTANFSCAAGL